MVDKIDHLCKIDMLFILVLYSFLVFLKALNTNNINFDFDCGVLLNSNFDVFCKFEICTTGVIEHDSLYFIQFS